MPNNWFSGGAIYDFCDEGLLFLVQDYLPLYKWERGKIISLATGWGGIQTKFPGGRGMDRLDDANPLATMRREVRTETGLTVLEGAELRKIELPPNRDDHQKTIFLVPIQYTVGKIRRKPSVDGRSYLFPPRWINASEAGIQLYRDHRTVGIKAYEELSMGVALAV